MLLFAPAVWAADLTLPEYERVELANGTVLLLSEKHDVPLIGMRAAVRGGSASDPASQSGLAELLATVLQKGAGERDAAEFAEAAAGVGGQLSVNAGVEVDYRFRRVPVAGRQTDDRARSRRIAAADAVQG